MDNQETPEFSFQWRIWQVKSELRTAGSDLEQITNQLIKSLQTPVADRLGRNTEYLVTKAGQITILETRIADLTRQLEWLEILERENQPVPTPSVNYYTHPDSNAFISYD